MSKRYPGNFITGNPVALSQTSNNGIWDTKDNYHAVNSGTWQEPDGIYEIGRSLRFKNSTGSLLTRTPSTASNRRTWTWSGWVKRASLGGVGGTYSYQVMMEADGTGQPGNRTSFMFDNVDRIDFFTDNTSTSRLRTSAVFRDLSAWYHVVFAMDTTQAQASNRMKIYVNGVQITAFETETYPSQNLQSGVNYNAEHRIGKPYDTFYYDGHMTEINHIDGQQLDASYFGYFDPNTNIWMPKRYTGGYGTNGFYLPFRDNDYLGMIGKDYSGTNEIAYSSDFSQSSFAAAGALTNQLVAPDGTATADYLYPTASSAVHYMYITGKPFVAGPYTASWYVKYVNHRWISAQLYDGTTTIEASFDLLNGVTGVVAAGATSTMQAVGDGWYRITITAVCQSGTGYHNVLFINNSDIVPYQNWTATGNERVAVWGAQHNRGRTADAYIPTSNSPKYSWTANNFNLDTVSVNYDSMVDSPTNVFTSATDIGGVVSGNYCTLNSNARDTSLSVTSAALRVATHGSATNRNIFGTMAIPPSAVCYFEVSVMTGSSTGNYFNVGVAPSTVGLNTVVGGSANTGFSIESDQSNQAIARIDGGGTAYGGGTWYNTGDIVQVAIDRVNNKIWFGKNNTWFGSGNPSTGANPASSTVYSSGDLIPTIGGYQSGPILEANFGQRPFAYTPPTGFKSLNTTNLQALGTSITGKAAIQANKWFDVNIYGGTSSAVTDITNSGFKPDLVWIKNRRVGAEGTGDNMLFDTARGGTAALQANRTDAEAIQTNFLTAFNENGFRPGTSTRTNETTSHYVAYQWKQSPTSGFNIVSYTGNGANNRAISHNLGVAPKMIIIKNRDATNGMGWGTWHASQPTKANYLNETGTFQVDSYAAYGFNEPNTSGTVPTSNSFYVSASGRTYNSDITNGNNQKLIAYLWSEIPGFSKFASYTGNGSSDGPFIYTGFRPKFLMIKSATASGSWLMLDTARNKSNIVSVYTTAENPGGEAWGSAFSWLDITANGFKHRNTGSWHNSSGVDYIYAAFAESPFALNNRAR